MSENFSIANANNILVKLVLVTVPILYLGK